MHQRDHCKSLLSLKQEGRNAFLHLKSEGKHLYLPSSAGQQTAPAWFRCENQNLTHPEVWCFWVGSLHTCPFMLRWPSETGWRSTLEASPCWRQEWRGVLHLAQPGPLKTMPKSTFPRLLPNPAFVGSVASMLENRFQPVGFMENSSNRPGQAGTVPFFLRGCLWTLWIRELRLKSLPQTNHPIEDSKSENNSGLSRAHYVLVTILGAFYSLFSSIPIRALCCQYYYSHPMSAEMEVERG